MVLDADPFLTCDCFYVDTSIHTWPSRVLLALKERGREVSAQHKSSSLFMVINSFPDSAEASEALRLLVEFGTRLDRCLHDAFENLRCRMEASLFCPRILTLFDAAEEFGRLEELVAHVGREDLKNAILHGNSAIARRLWLSGVCIIPHVEELTRELRQACEQIQRDRSEFSQYRLSNGRLDCFNRLHAWHHCEIKLAGFLAQTLQAAFPKPVADRVVSFSGATGGQIDGWEDDFKLY